MFCDNEIRDKKVETLNHRKENLSNYFWLEMTVEWQKMHKQQRNYLMDKDEMSESKHKSKQMSIKDYAKTNKVPKKK